jgi:hypothetical protein
MIGSLVVTCSVTNVRCLKDANTYHQGHGVGIQRVDFVRCFPGDARHVYIAQLFVALVVTHDAQLFAAQLGCIGVDLRPQTQLSQCTAFLSSCGTERA